jgi:hypothetical protein
MEETDAPARSKKLIGPSPGPGGPVLYLENTKEEEYHVKEQEGEKRGEKRVEGSEKDNAESMMYDTQVGDRGIGETREKRREGKERRR